MPGRATAHCIPICMQMVWCERRAYITRSELRPRHTAIEPERNRVRPREAVSHQDSRTHPPGREKCEMNDDFMHKRCLYSAAGSFGGDECRRTYQRVDFHRKLVLLVLHR